MGLVDEIISAEIPKEETVEVHDRSTVKQDLPRLQSALRVMSRRFPDTRSLVVLANQAQAPASIELAKFGPARQHCAVAPFAVVSVTAL